LRSLLDRETSGPLRYIERSFCHVWGTDGSHIGWRTFDEFLNAFGYKLKKSTGYDLLKREKALTDSNDIQAFKKRPDIGAMLSKLTQAQSSLESMQTEPNISDSVHVATDSTRKRPFTFDPSWYPELIEEINKHSDLPGFGFLMVQTFEIRRNPNRSTVLKFQVFRNWFAIDCPPSLYPGPHFQAIPSPNTTTPCAINRFSGSRWLEWAQPFYPPDHNIICQNFLTYRQEPEINNSMQLSG
jgi:hypothetical protein